ncbi:peptidase C69 [Candidatus Saganbacteria bacterium CG08_land_8_20_14_0_20_45_16]|uniref:Peptidase C69 n=1 Tax=Candidatus Saganbacteria bacterium CG08_land_8_20_14_0_20_45_16 TaxID=2014293 RepID=A0A2H0XTV0_UNCSA|nr:MAG: peptidase C69 [Candidatus Saganbacteria bacterium CG08_land_8_20_14_0_20_45_16]
MLSKESLEELIHTSLRSGGDFAEVFIEEANATSITCEDNKIEKISSGVEVGAGIRVINGTETIYQASSDTSFEALRNVALKLSKSINQTRKIKGISLTPSVSPTGTLQIKRRPNEVSATEKTDLVNLLNKTARAMSDKIKQVTVRYSDSNQAITVANSEGVYVEDNRIRTRYFINVIAEKNGILQTGYEAPGGTVGFELFDQYPPEKHAQIAAERALRMLDAPHAPSGKMMVVLSSEAGGTLIHEACGHALEADFIMKGTSIFAGRVGQKVASNLVTVIDDGTLAGRFGTYAFDDEGTPAQKTVLIENGILKGFLSDKYTAKQLGLSSSGNGRRQDFRHKPQPRMQNTMIAPGKMIPEAIIASIQNGLLVKHMGGGEVNVTNGDFVFDITEAYLIENGKVKHPVRGAIITGNGPRVLEIIDMVGSDLGFQTGVCGKFDHAPVSDAQPTIRIPEIIVGGRM